MNKKYNQIELLRFLFAVLIMVFHAHNVNNGLGHPIPLGHVFVEFFFFLTGYFTYLHVVRRMNLGVLCSPDTRYALMYMWKKIRKFIPYMFMEKKGDLVKAENGVKNNGLIAKMVCVYEGKEEEAIHSRGRILTNRHYFCGVNSGEANLQFWGAVRKAT